MNDKNTNTGATAPETLKYTDEADRCLGATGMAIAIVAFDGEDMLGGIDIDAEPDDMVDLTADFYFEGNPSLMATASWHKLIANFNITAGMLAGNVLCRRIVGKMAMPPASEHDYLRDIVVDEGVSTCSLEAEEAEALFDNAYNRLSRLFTHRAVHQLAHEMADMLARQRTLGRYEVISALRPLRML